MWKSNKKISQRRGPSLVGAKKFKKNPIARQAARVGGTPNGSGTELKYLDTLVSAAAAPAASSWSLGTLLNGMLRGDDVNNRDGRQIVVKALVFRWVMMLQAGSASGATGRILVVYDRQPNGTAASITDIMAQNSMLSSLNIDNNKRFVVLADVITPNITAGAGGQYSCSGKVYRKLNLVTNYGTGDTGTISDILGGSIYCYVSQDGGITGSGPAFTIRARIRFEDQ